MAATLKNKLWILAFSCLFVGCGSTPIDSESTISPAKKGDTTSLDTKRREAAEKVFQQTVQNYHLPSVDLIGPERKELLDKAAREYRQILRKFSDQEKVSAQSLRSLANIRVEQTRTNEAIRLYAQVGKNYPRESWEVIQAWKTASDLLWLNNQTAEAAKFDRQIIDTFDQPDMPAVIQTVVRAVKKRQQNNPMQR